VHSDWRQPALLPALGCLAPVAAAASVIGSGSALAVPLSTNQSMILVVSATGSATTMHMHTVLRHQSLTHRQTCALRVPMVRLLEPDPEIHYEVKSDAVHMINHTRRLRLNQVKRMDDKCAVAFESFRSCFGPVLGIACVHAVLVPTRLGPAPVNTATEWNAEDGTIKDCSSEAVHRH